MTLIKELLGNDQTVTSLFGDVNGFRNKLSFLKTCLEKKSDLSHFASCKNVAEELKDFGGSELSTLLLKLKIYYQNSMYFFRILKL